MTTAIDSITHKLLQLPPERLIEVADFIDFIAERERTQQLSRNTRDASAARLQEVWDNEIDSAYDAL
jgi:hypothetical protein